MEFKKECWDLLNEINNFCNKKVIKNLTSKIKFNHQGTKIKWRDIQEIELLFDNNETTILIVMEYTKYYNDSGKNKNILERETYIFKELKDIEEEDVKAFLTAKKRVLVISNLKL